MDTFCAISSALDILIGQRFDLVVEKGGKIPSRRADKRPQQAVVYRF
jgi:hypothetical protein